MNHSCHALRTSTTPSKPERPRLAWINMIHDQSITPPEPRSRGGCRTRGSGRGPFRFKPRPVPLWKGENPQRFRQARVVIDVPSNGASISTSVLDIRRGKLSKGASIPSVSAPECSHEWIQPGAATVVRSDVNLCLAPPQRRPPPGSSVRLQASTWMNSGGTLSQSQTPLPDR